MKRTRKERTSGRVRVKERKACLRCGRNLMKRHYKILKGRTEWRCNKCGMTYQYDFGELKKIGRVAREEWWMGEEWVKVGDGMLVVYGGLDQV